MFVNDASATAWYHIHPRWNMRMRRFLNTYVAVGIALVLIAGGYAFLSKKSPAPVETPPVLTTQATSSVVYQNARYGFDFSLPENWKGYSLVRGTWKGFANTGPAGDATVAQGPLISIRNPAWTAAKPYQDIPIIIFTLSQWDALLRNKFEVSAAPINPSLLGANAAYVFALPARYNYAFPAGYKEVATIMASKPLTPLPSSGTPPTNGKILLCGGIPNDSTQNITETTRLFINLPKDVYPDREHNLRFKTVSGNATAGSISNAGPYGEAFQANQNCWSYYYEFDGTGEVDVTAKAATVSASDYFVRFIVRPAR